MTIAQQKKPWKVLLKLGVFGDGTSFGEQSIKLKSRKLV